MCLQAEDIEALRKHFDSLARLNGVGVTHELPHQPHTQQQEYLQWQVGL